MDFCWHECTYNVTLRRVRATIVAVEQQKALGTQGEMRIRHIVIYCLSDPSIFFHSIS